MTYTVHFRYDEKSTFFLSFFLMWTFLYGLRYFVYRRVDDNVLQSTLNIVSVESSDFDGEYECWVKNKHATLSPAAVLIIRQRRKLNWLLVVFLHFTTSPPKVIWEERITIHHGRECTRPLHVYTSCAMTTADESNDAAAGTLQPHRSATCVLYVALLCEILPNWRY